MPLIPHAVKIAGAVMTFIAIIGLLSNCEIPKEFHADNAYGMTANVLLSLHAMFGWFCFFLLSIAIYICGMLAEITERMKPDPSLPVAPVAAPAVAQKVIEEPFRG